MAQPGPFTTFDRLLAAWFGNIARVLIPGGGFYIWGGYANCANYPPVLKAMELYFSQAVIWIKEHPVLTRKDFMGNHEWCFYGWKEGAAHRFFGPNNVPDTWSIKKVNPQSMVHLTEKPVELARRAGISAPPCLRRVRRLEEAGIIRGYHADSDPQRLGWEITFFAIVGLESQKEAVLSAFEAMVAEWPEVRECHMIRGGGDFLLKLVARDTAHENQLTQKLTGAAAVARVQTLQTIRTSRNLSGVPL